MDNQVSKEILAFENDHIWVHNNFDNLLKDYSEQWIGVKDQRVIASDPELSRLKDKLLDPAHTCIEFITREHLEMIL